MRDCYAEVAGWMAKLGMAVRIDAAGNLRGTYPAEKPDAPILLIGSHLDTVPVAGAYDGVLGVILGLTIAEALDGRKLPFAIEIVGFSEEEGVRFGCPFIGSRALVGRLDHDLLSRQDVAGISIAQAIEDFGLSLSDLPQARLDDKVFSYLEFHIEQGPVLESLSLPLAAVTAIAGQTRMEFTFHGQSNHAGTTPMNLRHDALAGAAEWIANVERAAQQIVGLVATVGKIDARPGATNVIAGEVRVSLDVRHGLDEVRKTAVKDLILLAQEIARKRGLGLTSTENLDQAAVSMNPALVAEIERAISHAGAPPHRMISGAGHDAMIIAEKIPSAMIFLRTPGGVSHHPSESVALEDVEKAIECGMHLLNQLASATAFQEHPHFDRTLQERNSRA